MSTTPPRPACRAWPSPNPASAVRSGGLGSNGQPSAVQPGFGQGSRVESVCSSGPSACAAVATTARPAWNAGSAWAFWPITSARSAGRSALSAPPNGQADQTALLHPRFLRPDLNPARSPGFAPETSLGCFGDAAPKQWPLVGAVETSTTLLSILRRKRVSA